MRSIKFRAWDKRKKEWLFGFKSSGGFHLLGEIVMLGELSSIPLTELNNIEITQFTGWKDSKGKEIYEGDILQQKKTSGARFQVVWDEDGKWWVKEIGENGFGSNALWSFAKVTQVIGNIYENPDLLK